MLEDSVEETPSAELLQGYDGGSTRMFEHPGKLARCREGADRCDDCADLCGAERGNGPLGAVGDEQCDPVAVRYAGREQRLGERVDARLERGVVEPLATADDRFAAWRGGGQFVDQIAPGPAVRGLRHEHCNRPNISAAASREKPRCLRRNRGWRAP